MHFFTRVNKYVKEAVEGKPLSVWKTAPDQVRGYTYVGDCARVIDFCIEHSLFDGSVYNVVSENATTSAILDSIRSLVPDLDVAFTDSQEINTYSFGMDDTKIRARGFLPTGTLEEGIAELMRALRVPH